MMAKHYLHLDFKGVAPSLNKLKEWLVFFRECGFDGLVFEYDCRIAWKNWPGCAREWFTKGNIRELISFAEGLGFETMPLMQIFGHLEWALAKSQNAKYREGEFIDEICPLNPEALEKICHFADEVMELHPSKMIHLGGDETWYIGRCPKCREHAEKDPRGRLGGYVDFVTAVCQHVAAKGVRPMIWADMFIFWQDKKVELAKQLPSNTILVDWEYDETIQYYDALQQSGLEVWGASALHCSSYEHWWRLQDIPGLRIDNALMWNRKDCNVIHTTWGRPASLWNLYAPWHAIYPCFIAAGNPAQWKKHPWRTFIEKLTLPIFRNHPHELLELEKEAEMLPITDSLSEQARFWLVRALRYQRMEKEYQGIFYGRKVVNMTRKYLDADFPSFNRYYVGPVEKLRGEIDVWRKDTAEFFRKNELSDVDEFLDEKTVIFDEL